MPIDFPNIEPPVKTVRIIKALKALLPTHPEIMNFENATSLLEMEELKPMITLIEPENFELEWALREIKKQA